MNDDGVKIVISGQEALWEALRTIAPKLRVRALRNALAAGARIVQAEARRRAPVLKRSTNSGANAIRRGVRAPGTVRKAISVRTSKVARRAGDVGVFVNVKPNKKGPTSPVDPYYWRWLNFGWNPANDKRDALSRAVGRWKRRRLSRTTSAKTKEGARFLEAGVRMLPRALSVIMGKLPAIIEKLNRPKAPPP